MVPGTTHAEFQGSLKDSCVYLNHFHLKDNSDLNTRSNNPQTGEKLIMEKIILGVR